MEAYYQEYNYPDTFDKSHFRELKGDLICQWTSELYLEWSKRHKALYRYPLLQRNKIYDPIEDYAGYGFQRINEGLRSGSIKPGESCQVREMLLSMLSAPPIPENIIVYRFVDESVLTKMISQKEDVFYEAGFMSTTFDPGICETSEAVGVSQALLRVYIPSGSRAVYVDYISNRAEYELILPCGMSLKYLQTVEADESIKKYGISKVHEVLYIPTRWLFSC